MRLYIFIIYGLAWSLVQGQDPLQKTMLTTVPSAGRFTVTDRVWPANVGEADVCIWPDDKLAAVSFGVDDNIQPNHAWWQEMAGKYDFKMTWWVVTSHPNKEGQAEFNPFFGTWDDFKILHDAGHEIGSHSVTHNTSMTLSDYGMELGDSKTHIEAGIPGHSPKTYAGPGGNTPPADTTAKFYISHRGVNGGTNLPNKTDYSNTKVDLDFDPACILTPGRNSWPCGYRGWKIYYYHNLDEAKKTALENDIIAPVYENRDNIWVGTYAQGAMYGQSRDTHTLTVNSVTDSQVTFTLTDSMNDTLFDYPLTVKVRIDNGWGGCIAVQNGNDIETEIIENDGNKYTLVKAVPDKGKVTISNNSGITEIRHPERSRRMNGFPVSSKLISGKIYNLNGSIVPRGHSGGTGLYIIYDGITVSKMIISR